MAKFLSTLFSFSNGELNPRLLGRTDTKEYYSSAKEITNFSLGDRGGLNQYRGTQTIFNQGDTNDNLVTLTFGEKYYLSGFALHEVSESNGDITAVEIPVTINTPNLFTDFGDSVFINDTLIVTHRSGGFPPNVLRRIEDQWVWEDWVTFASQVGAVDATVAEREWRAVALSPQIADTENYLTLSGGNTVTATFDLVTSVTDVGRHIIISDLTTDYVAKITGVTNLFTVTVSFLGAVPTNGDYFFYRKIEWGVGRWPKLVDYHQGRLLFANSNQSPDTIWCSEAGNIVNFSPVLQQDGDSVASSPFILQPDTKDATPISWIVVERFVTFGTHSSEYIAQGVEGSFSSQTTYLREVSRYGSSETLGLGVRAQSSTYFIERDGKTLREMSYSEENGGYVSRNIGLLGPEVPNVTKLLYNYTDKKIFLVTESLVYVVTVDKAAGLLGWSKIELAVLPFWFDASTYTDTIGGLIVLNDNSFLIGSSTQLQNYKVVAHLFYTENNYFSVTDSNSEVLYPIGVHMDRVVKGVNNPNDYKLPDDYVYIAYVSVYAYDADNRQWVSIDFQEASSHPDFADGDLYITSAFEVSAVAIDVSPSARIETVPIQTGSPIGDSQIAFQKIDKLTLRLADTRRGFVVGTSEDSLEEAEIEGLFTGVKQISPSGCPEYDHSVIIKNESTLPMVLVSISARGIASEG